MTLEKRIAGCNDYADAVIRSIIHAQMTTNDPLHGVIAFRDELARRGYRVVRTTGLMRGILEQLEEENIALDLMDDERIEIREIE